MAFAPEPLAGYLQKQSPSAWRWDPWDRRYFEIKERRMRWWQCKEDTEMPEVYMQKNLKGVINLCQAELSLATDDSDIMFQLAVRGGGWSSVASHHSSEPRGFVFEATESEHSRDDWVSALRRHIECGALMLVDTNSFEIGNKGAADTGELELKLPVEIRNRLSASKTGDVDAPGQDAQLRIELEEERRLRLTELQTFADELSEARSAPTSPFSAMSSACSSPTAKSPRRNKGTFANAMLKELDHALEREVKKKFTDQNDREQAMTKVLSEKHRQTADMQEHQNAIERRLLELEAKTNEVEASRAREGLKAQEEAQVAESRLLEVEETERQAAEGKLAELREKEQALKKQHDETLRKNLEAAQQEAKALRSEQALAEKRVLQLEVAKQQALEEKLVQDNSKASQLMFAHQELAARSEYHEERLRALETNEESFTQEIRELREAKNVKERMRRSFLDRESNLESKISDARKQDSTMREELMALREEENQVSANETKYCEDARLARKEEIMSHNDGKKKQSSLEDALHDARNQNASMREEQLAVEQRLAALEAAAKEALQAKVAAENRAQELEASNKTMRRDLEDSYLSGSDDEVTMSGRKKRRGKTFKLDKEQLKIIEEVKQVVSASQAKALGDMHIDEFKDFKDKLSNIIQSARASFVPEEYLADAEQRRRKLHNCIEDMKGSIRVFCRVRPLSQSEKARDDVEVTTVFDTMTIGVARRGEKVVPYHFDAVFAPGSQDQVFEDCRDLVQSAVDGYNVTIFAYGQTGAGKTFTMYGAPGQEGILSRTVTELFTVIGNNKDHYDYTVKGSMLELYRNDLIDLLSKGTDMSQEKLDLKTDKAGNTKVPGLIEETCSDATALLSLLVRGQARRTVAATAMNAHSSRSHLVVYVRITSVNKETQAKVCSKLLMCDLAGSERLKKSQVTADIQKESIEINRSLTALGDVIEALTKKQKEVPYRNHKLTQLMRDSIGGSSKTLMFVNVSPAISNMDETVSSLKYATRAKKVKNTCKRSSYESLASQLSGNSAGQDAPPSPPESPDGPGGASQRGSVASYDA